jgi:hypothetical protein
MTANAIIFSKDRAMQLDGLLRSIQQFAPALWPPTVLYRSSAEDFAWGYAALRMEFDYRDVRWVQRIGAPTLKDWLMAASVNAKAPLTCLLVDDDLFYRPLSDFAVDPGTAYAPRLGLNCTWCFNEGRPQSEGTGDFTCHTSIDGHIYRTDEIMPRIASIEFTIPSQMENKLGHINPPFRLKYADHSCLVGIPHNRVQQMYGYPNGGGTVQELNERFLAGERIDLDAMDFSDVHGSHQLIEYKFKVTERFAVTEFGHGHVWDSPKAGTLS